MNKKQLDEKFMMAAIIEARKNISMDMDGGPFGACIVKDSEIVAVARNTVLKYDATCHAEINAIRQASKKMGRYDLSGCEIFSTTEPCPMCFSAIHWARIGRIVYGTDISDADKAGFNELELTNLTLKKLGKSSITIVSGVLREECLKLFADWLKHPKKKLY